MEYLRIVDGIIKEHACGYELPKGCTKVNAFYGVTETKANWYNLPEGTRIPDDVLVKKGIREDNRGVYYNTTTKESINITELDKPSPKGTTRLKPSRPTDIWKGGKWTLDLLKEKDIVKAGVNPAMEHILNSLDRKVIKHRDQQDIAKARPGYKPSRTEAEYIQILEDRELYRDLAKKSIICIEGITTEQGLLDAIELFKTDFTKMTEVKRALKEVERRLKLLGVK